MSEFFKNPFFNGQNLKKKLNRTQNDSDFASDFEDEMDSFSETSSSESSPPRYVNFRFYVKSILKF